MSSNFTTDYGAVKRGWYAVRNGRLRMYLLIALNGRLLHLEQRIGRDLGLAISDGSQRALISTSWPT